MQTKFKIKLASGLWATGLIDVMGNIREADGTHLTHRTVYSNFINDLLPATEEVQTKDDFMKVVSDIQSDPKHKYVISIYGVVVY